VLIHKLSRGLLALSLTLVAASAHAQSAAAEDLFQRGQKLMEEGKTSEACTLLAESQKIEPSTGTLLNLAVCHEKEKKTATAWAEYNAAANMARAGGRQDREKYAQQKAEALAPQLRKVQVDVKQPLTNPEVKVDGQANGIINIAFPVDPGEHEIVVGAAKKKPWSTKVKFPDGPGITHVEVPALEDAPEAPSGGAAGGSVGLQNGEVDTGGNSKRVLGFILGGVGLASIGASVFFFVQAKLQDDQSQDEATTGNNFKRQIGILPKAQENAETFLTASSRDHDAAVRSQTVAYITGGVGVVALGVGIYLIFTAKDSSPKSAGKIQNFRVAPLLGATNGAAASFSF
jgi:hypothetical protein